MRAMDSIRKYYRYLGWSGLIAGIRGKLSLRSTEYALRTSFSSYPIALRTKTSDFKVFEQVFVKEEYAVNLKREPNTIIDAGANIGLASVYFAQCYPDAKILSIEPEPENFRMLVKNCRDYPNIVPVQAALWYEAGEINVFDPGEGSWSFRTQKLNGNPHATRVRALTLDFLLREYGFESVDVLKMDIEGAEKEVLQHAAAWIGKVGVLVIELHERFKEGCNRSFYNATNHFEHEWRRGENIFLSMDAWADKADQHKGDAAWSYRA